METSHPGKKSMWLLKFNKNLVEHCQSINYLSINSRLINYIELSSMALPIQGEKRERKKGWLVLPYIRGQFKAVPNY